MEQTTFEHITLVSEGQRWNTNGNHKIKDLTKNLFNEVTHLIECQKFMNERVKILEAKGQEIGLSRVAAPADEVAIKIIAPYNHSPRHITTLLIPYNSASRHITALLVI